MACSHPLNLQKPTEESGGRLGSGWKLQMPSQDSPGGKDRPSWCGQRGGIRARAGKDVPDPWRTCVGPLRCPGLTLPS